MPGGGQSTSNTAQSSTTAPGAMTAPTVQGIVGALNPLISSSGLTSPQQTAINQLTTNAQAGNPFAPGVTGATDNMLAGGGAMGQNPTLSANLAAYKASMAPYTDPTYSTVNSPAVQAALQAANNDVTSSVNGQFAAAGRDGSGYNQEAIARGIASADAPIILNQANTDTATRMGAANSVYGAGNTTSGAISGNTQNSVANQNAGITAAPAALTAQNWGPTATIAAQELGQAIPAQNLGLLSQIGIPLAGLNSTTNGTSNTTNNASLDQQIATLGGMLGAGPSTGANGATNAGSGVLGLLGMI